MLLNWMFVQEFYAWWKNFSDMDFRSCFDKTFLKRVSIFTENQEIEKRKDSFQNKFSSMLRLWETKNEKERNMKHSQNNQT